MKNAGLIILFSQLIFTSNFVRAEQVLTLDVIDQNFNSTERIVIDQEAIKRSRATNLAQVLSSQANIVITSTNFQPNSVFIRGGDSSHVLFVIDDVPTYDSSSPQKTVNLGNLDISTVKKIEILKGSQSVIYGGQALTAVIKIYTLPDQFKNSGHFVVAGADHSSEAAVGFDHLVKSLLDSNPNQMLISLNTKFKDAQNASPVLDSNKRYPQKTLSADGAIVLKMNANYRATVKFNYSNDTNQITTTESVPPPTPANVRAVDTDENFLNSENYGTNIIFKNLESFSFSLSQQKNRRQFFQEAKNSLSTPKIKTDQDYIGELANARLEIILPKTEKFSGLVGATYANEKFEQKDLPSGFNVNGSTQYEGLFIKGGLSLIPQVLLIETGFRSEFSNFKRLADTYQLGLTFYEDLRLEYSSGFKSPSLFHLFAPGYGNPNLKSEKAETFNLAYEKKWSESWTSSFSIFDSNYKNLIIYLAGQYQNVSSSRTTGIELATNYSDQDNAFFYHLFLAYQEPNDSSTGTWLVKRPLRSGGAKVTKLFYSDKASITLELNHVGERRDKQTSSSYINVENYTLIHFSANLKITDQTEVFSRLNNLTNQTYQSSYGYYDTGAKGSLGVQVNF